MAPIYLYNIFNTHLYAKIQQMILHHYQTLAEHCL